MFWQMSICNSRACTWTLKHSKLMWWPRIKRLCEALHSHYNIEMKDNIFCFTSWQISDLSTVCRVNICVFLQFLMLQCISQTVRKRQSKPRLILEERERVMEGFRKASWYCLALEEEWTNHQGYRRESLNLTVKRS